MIAPLAQSNLQLQLSVQSFGDHVSSVCPFFYCPLNCLSFYLQLLFTSFASSNFSYIIWLFNLLVSYKKLLILRKHLGSTTFFPFFGGARVAHFFLVFCVMVFCLFSISSFCVLFHILSLDCPYLTTPVFSKVYCDFQRI